MRITTIRSEGLAAQSYFVSSKNEAVVIDPRRDALVYHNLAKELDCKISHIFETHRNEDYVIGSLELQSYNPSAEICHSKATKFGYGNMDLADGEDFKVGSLKIICRNTPGHTDDSMCYVVTNSSTSPNQTVMFTGDTLFVNEVGRTDLVDVTKHEQMSRKLYKSLHEIILTYDDDVTIHPGHGAGSVCGGDIGEQDSSTIGFEKKHNAWLSMDEEEFVESKVKQRLTLSKYFKRCEKLNTDGPPLLASLEPLKEFEVDEYERLLEDPNHQGIDTRDSSVFLHAHIPGSISLNLSNIGLQAGWVLKSKQNFSFILNDYIDLELAKSTLYRVGLDNVIGYLKDGFSGWLKSGKTLESMGSISSDDMKSEMERNMINLVDVRESYEFERGWIPSSQSLPLTGLNESILSIDTSKKIVTICSSGHRSTTAASIMKKHGVDNIAVLQPGLTKWIELGYPMEW